jgi:hypothetical protein
LRMKMAMACWFRYSKVQRCVAIEMRSRTLP